MKSEDETLRTSWTLVARLKDLDDGESWRTFYQLYRGVIMGVARKAGLREDEAEVALQETMASISKKIGEFEANPGRGSFHAWLFKLAGWRIKDQVKRRLPVGRAGPQASYETSQTPTVERIPDPRGPEIDALFEPGWREQLLKQAMSQLEVEVSAPQYQAFHLLTAQGKSVAEAAQLLGKSRAQVYLVKHRVGKVLRRIVKRLEQQMG
jgi:RNA polymerase sigma-70 factor (ECF subfamily)